MTPEERRARNRAYNKKYRATEKGKIAARRSAANYAKTPNGKAIAARSAAKYSASAKGKATHRRSWVNYLMKHREESVAYRTEHRLKTNASTLKVATQHKQLWTTAQDNLVISMTAQGFNAREIALEVGRTYLATKRRKGQLLKGIDNAKSIRSSNAGTAVRDSLSGSPGMLETSCDGSGE